MTFISLKSANPNETDPSSADQTTTKLIQRRWIWGLNLAWRLQVSSQQHCLPGGACGTCHLRSLGSFLCLCLHCRGTFDVHMQKRWLAPAQTHSQTRACSERTALGGHLVSHSLDCQSVHSLLPTALPLWRWLCSRVNYMWLDQILHPVLVSSEDWVWLSSYCCKIFDNPDTIFCFECHQNQNKRKELTLCGRWRSCI